MQKTDYSISHKDLNNWFKKQGFKKAEFENGKTYVSNFWNGHSVSVKLIEHKGFESYYKSAYGGAVLLFEVAIENDKLVYDCYCPIWLFGFWNKKVSFKENAGGLTKYRKEGYYMEKRFLEFLESKV